MTTEQKYELAGLLNRWNEATCPWRLRTDHEHERNRQLACAIQNKIKRMGAIQGQHYKEFSNGSLWPINN